MLTRPITGVPAAITVCWSYAISCLYTWCHKEVSHHSKVFIGSWLDVDHTHTQTHTNNKKKHCLSLGILSPPCLFTLGSMTMICSKHLLKTPAGGSCSQLWRFKLTVKGGVCVPLCVWQVGKGRRETAWLCDWMYLLTPCVSPDVSRRTTRCWNKNENNQRRREDGNRHAEKKSTHPETNAWSDSEFVCETGKDRKEQTVVSASHHHCPVWQASRGLALCDCVVLKSSNIISSHFSNYVLVLLSQSHSWS